MSITKIIRFFFIFFYSKRLFRPNAGVDPTFGFGM